MGRTLIGQSNLWQNFVIYFIKKIQWVELTNVKLSSSHRIPAMKLDSLK